MNSKLLPLALVPFMAGIATAQSQTKVVPTFAKYADGSGGSAFPLAYTSQRCQQIWDAGVVANTVALIQSMALRGDAMSGQMSAFTLTGTKVSLSHTTVSAASMSTTYANNRTGTATVVFNANLNVPAVNPPSSGPAPFNVLIPCATPFVYTVPQGNLMLELETPASMPQKSGWITDAHGTGGLVGQFGTSGKPSGGDTLTLVGDGSGCVPGGTARVTTATMVKSYPGALFLGSSDQQWLSIPLPLDLNGIGAPGNHLYTGMELQVPHSWAQIGGRWVSQVSLPVPNQNVWIGVVVYAQSAIIDWQANQFGAVFSNALSIGVGQTGAQRINHIGNYDPTATDGNYGIGNSGGGFIVQFTGVIN